MASCGMAAEGIQQKNGWNNWKGVTKSFNPVSLLRERSEGGTG